MVKYLRNAQEVLIEREIEGGFLVRNTFYSEDWDGSYEDDLIYFVEEVFDTPPTKKLHKEVKQLNEEIETLQKQRDEIRDLKSSEERLLTEIKKRDFVQGLVDYLNGDFNYVVYPKDMRIVGKDNVYISNYIKIINTKKGGFSLFTLQDASYESFNDTPIRVFKTIQEARDYGKKELIRNLKYNTEAANYKWNSKSIKSWFDRLDRSSKLKEDEDVIKIYNEKFEEAKKKEDLEHRLKLQKEIEEKQKRLSAIQ